MSGWDKLAQNIAKLADIPADINVEISNKINELIQKQFDDGKDPYNFAWKTLAPSTVRRKGHSSILIETTKLRGSTVAEPIDGGGINLTSIDYGMFHQDGTRFMPRRAVLPYGTNLPTSWQKLISDQFLEDVRETLSTGKSPTRSPKASHVSLFDVSKGPSKSESKSDSKSSSDNLSIAASESESSGKGRGGSGSAGSGTKKKKKKRKKSLIKKTRKKK